MLYRLLAGSLIGIATLAPATIGSGQDREIPATIIRVVRFTDNGRTYTVDLETGRVTRSDVEPDPVPVPPAPSFSPFQDDIKQAFLSAVPSERRKEAAGCLWHSIEVTLAEAGGLNYDAQKIIDEFKSNTDFVCDKRLKGLDIGSILAKHGVSDRQGLIKALREIMAVMESLK